jgi:hypothetical protein
VEEYFRLDWMKYPVSELPLAIETADWMEQPFGGLRPHVCQLGMLAFPTG